MSPDRKRSANPEAIKFSQEARECVQELPARTPLLALYLWAESPWVNSKLLQEVLEIEVPTKWIEFIENQSDSNKGIARYALRALYRHFVRTERKDLTIGEIDGQDWGKIFDIPGLDEKPYNFLRDIFAQDQG